MPPRLLRVLEWLLRQVTSRAAASAAIGDIYEELHQRCAAGRTPRSPMLWVNAQTIKAVAAETRTACARGIRVLRMTLRDAACAIRRGPRHARTILVILAVGISAATVTFSVVDAVVLRPLPLDRSEQLMLLSGRHIGGWPTALAPEEFWAVHDHVAALDGVAPLRWMPSAVTVGSVTEELKVVRSTTELFRVFRLKPAVGRLWSSDDEQRGEMGLAVIEYGFWQRRFAANPDILRRTLRIHGKTYRVLGVLEPQAANAKALGWSADVYIPDVPAREGSPTGVSRTVTTIGRIREGATLEQLDAQVKSALAPLAARKPYGYTDWHPEVRRWQTALVGDVRGWMLLVLGAVTLVVLIACVNAANLMMTRSTERSRELAVRSSLGASRRQLALTLLIESLLLSAAATICALLLAAWGVIAAKRALPPGIFRVDAIALNGRVFAAAAGAGILTGILFGLLPAWQASRVSIVSLLKASGVTATPSRRAWRSALLVSQIACIGVLLVISTLFVASFIHVTRADLGLDRSNLIGVSALRSRGTVNEILDRLAQLPGVTGVAGVTGSSLPLVGPAFGGGYADARLRPNGAPEESAIQMQTYRVTSNYFDVTGMSFRRGSTWVRADAPDVEPVVIDELAARRLFGERDPIGLSLQGRDVGEIFTIVGVTRRVLWRGPDHEARPTVYLPVPQNAKAGSARFFVRTSPPPVTLVRAIESAVAPFSTPGTPSDVRVVEDAFRQITATRRFNAGVMAIFALLAIIIGAAGVYATITSLVAQQTHEIGVRLALGATTDDIAQRVLFTTGRYVLLGLALGLPAAWWISRGFAALFFQVRSTDLSTYAIVAGVITFAGIVAAIVPARRASRVDPLVSLRSA
jgi:putative ABC transport system permease protein